MNKDYIRKGVLLGAIIISMAAWSGAAEKSKGGGKMAEVCHKCGMKPVVHITFEKNYQVDSCIANIVYALNDIGIGTTASCCGHGRQPGSIILKDGREIRIFKNFDDARKVDKLFPPINED